MKVSYWLTSYPEWYILIKTNNEDLGRDNIPNNHINYQLG